jgi:hypothetical protein
MMIHEISLNSNLVRLSWNTIYEQTLFLGISLSCPLFMFQNSPWSSPRSLSNCDIVSFKLNAQFA